MKLFKSKSEKGQSLVEMAIAAPLLIFFLLGIFEVGAVVRNYLTLVNVNREVTRFAVRPGYLDFTTDTTAYDSYAKVRDWASTSASNQLNIDFTDTATTTGNTTLIISHLVVDTGKPCEDIYDNPDACDCDAFVDDPGSVTPYTADDLILHPGMPGQEYQAETFGPEVTVTGVHDTRLDYEAMVEELSAQNNKFNCEIIKKGGLPSANNVIVTELFIDQPQLFGFPFISNPYTDPVPLYTQTSMRLVGGVRNLVYNNTGHYCDSFPFVVHKDTIDWHLGDSLDNTPPGPSIYINQDVDIFNGKRDVGGGPGSDDMGWLTWNPDFATGSGSEQYLAENLQNSNYSLSDYTNARVPGDHQLSAGDWVASSKGDKAAVEASLHLVSALIDREDPVLRIPVWDDFDTGHGGEVDAYHIIGFAWVQIKEVSNIDLPGKVVIATYLGDASGYCQGTPVTGNPPEAEDDDYEVVKGTTEVLTTVLDNDTDDDGPLEIVDVRWVGPEKGEIVSYTSTTVTYKAPSTGGGSAKLQYSIYDNHGNYDTAIITIDIKNN